MFWVSGLYPYEFLKPLVWLPDFLTARSTIRPPAQMPWGFRLAC